MCCVWLRALSPVSLGPRLADSLRMMNYCERSGSRKSTLSRSQTFPFVPCFEQSRATGRDSLIATDPVNATGPNATGPRTRCRDRPPRDRSANATGPNATGPRTRQTGHLRQVANYELRMPRSRRQTARNRARADTALCLLLHRSGGGIGAHRPLSSAEAAYAVMADG